MMKKPQSYLKFSTIIFLHIFIFLQSLLIHYNFIQSVRTNINLLYAQRFISYYAEDTDCLQYKNQTVNAVREMISIDSENYTRCITCCRFKFSGMLFRWVFCPYLYDISAWKEWSTYINCCKLENIVFLIVAPCIL